MWILLIIERIRCFLWLLWIAEVKEREGGSVYQGQKLIIHSKECIGRTPAPNRYDLRLPLKVRRQMEYNKRFTFFVFPLIHYALGTRSLTHLQWTPPRPGWSMLSPWPVHSHKWWSSILTTCGYEAQLFHLATCLQSSWKTQSMRINSKSLTTVNVQTVLTPFLEVMKIL